MGVSEAGNVYKRIFQPDCCVTALTSVENSTSGAVEVKGLP